MYIGCSFLYFSFSLYFLGLLFRIVGCKVSVYHEVMSCFILIETTTFIYLKKISTRKKNNPSRMYKKCYRGEEIEKREIRHTQGGKMSPTKEAKCIAHFLANWSATWLADQRGHEL